MKYYGWSLLIFLMFLQPGKTQGQQNASLGFAFFKENRKQLRESLPYRSAAVLFAAPFHSPSPQLSPEQYADYQQSPEFFYLTGQEAPKCILVLFNPSIKYGGKEVEELFFYPSKDFQLETFTGQKIDHGNFGQKEKIEKWNSFCIDFLAGDQFRKILTLPVDYGTLREPGFFPTNALLESFYNALAPGFPFSGRNLDCYRIITGGDRLGPKELSKLISARLRYYPELAEDPLLVLASRVETQEELENVVGQVRSLKVDVQQMVQLVEEQRAIKSPDEVNQLKKVVSVLTSAIRKGVQSLESNVSSDKVRGALHQAIYANGAKPAASVRAIAGTGTRFRLYNGPAQVIQGDDAVLLDVPIQMGGYCGWVTRTLSANGRLKGRSQDKMEELIRAHKAAMQQCRPGKNLTDLAATFSGAMGVSKGEDSWFEVKGIGAGLQEPVRAGGRENELAAGMVVVVSSGWFGKSEGFFLRDMVRITASGPEILTAEIPMEPERLLPFAGK